MIFETLDYELFARMIKRAITDQLFFESGATKEGVYFIKYTGQ